MSARITLRWRVIVVRWGALLLPASQALAQLSASPYTTGYRYDANRRLTGTINPDPDNTGSIKFAAVRNSYDASGRLIKIERGELATWQPESVSPSAWSGFTVFQLIDSTFDAMDRKIKEVLSAGAVTYTVTQYSYDPLGRPECTTTRMNPSTFANLPTNVCSASAQGGNGPDRILKNSYDLADQLVQVHRAVTTALEQANVTYSYTLNGKREFVIDANGNRAQMIYDGLDRQTRWIFPSPTRPTGFDPTSAGTALATAGSVNGNDYEGYAYDANGNRTSLRKRSEYGQPVGSQTINYGYDPLNRISVKDIPGGTGADVYYGYDLRGLQLFARFASTSGQGISSAYDGFGRLTDSTSNVGGTSRTLSYKYDADGDRLRLTFPDSQYLTFDYDGLDRLTAVKQTGITTVATIAYNRKGERVGLTGGVSSTYTYDPVSRLASITHDLAGAAQDVTYCLGTIVGTSCTPSYNAAGQILTRTVSNDAYAMQGIYKSSRMYTVTGLNQYSAAGSSSPTYDVNGNLTSYQGTSYTYDIENRLINATGSTNATLAYDPLGRLSTTAGPSNTRFLYDGDNLAAEYDGVGTLLRRYVFGSANDEPLLLYQDSAFEKPLAIRSDNQGSIVVLSDSGGTSVGINSYDEWGTPASSNVGRFGYTGQTMLPELKLYYYKARIYSPRLGRFLQTDPIGYSDQINLYTYVANDPVNRIDPRGEDDEEIVVTAPRPPTIDIIPPVFIPTTAQNTAFAKAAALQTEKFFRRIAQLVGSILFNENSSEPSDGAIPGRETKGPTIQYEKPDGDINTANENFDKAVTPGSVSDKGNGIRVGTTEDGRTVVVRPNSTDGRPTVEVRRPNGRGYEVRYGPKSR